VDPRADLGDMEKRKFLPSAELELRPLSRPAHSQLLYRLCTRVMAGNDRQYQRNKPACSRNSQPFKYTTWCVRLMSPAEYMHLAYGYSAECTFQRLLGSCLPEPNRKPLISFGYHIYVYWNFFFP
jgi:hypothetical protein